MQTVALIIITARTNWDNEVCSLVHPCDLSMEALINGGGAHGDASLTGDEGDSATAANRRG